MICETLEQSAKEGAHLNVVTHRSSELLTLDCGVVMMRSGSA
jgi:hypothetical protein